MCDLSVQIQCVFGGNNQPYKRRMPCLTTALTRTWLHGNTSESATALKALQRVHSDRKNEAVMGKAMLSCLFSSFFDNNRCCNPSCITVKAHICSQDVTADMCLLARALKQHYFHKPLLSMLLSRSQFTQMLHVMLHTW